MAFNQVLYLFQFEQFYFISDQELREAFRVFDEEGTGFVSASDLKYILVDIMGEKEDEVKGMMKEVKVSKDGQLNYEEFINIVLK